MSDTRLYRTAISVMTAVVPIDPDDSEHEHDSEIELTVGREGDGQSADEVGEGVRDASLDGDRPRNPHSQGPCQADRCIDDQGDLENCPRIDLANDASNSTNRHGTPFGAQLTYGPLLPLPLRRRGPAKRSLLVLDGSDREG